MSLTSGLSATKTGFDLIKNAVEILKRPEVDVHEVQARLIELQALMLEARSALVDAQEENQRIKRQLEELTNAQLLAKDMEYVIDGGFYVRQSEADKGVIACCPICWTKDGKVIPMENQAVGYYWCSVHRNQYKTKTYRPTP